MLNFRSTCCHLRLVHLHLVTQFLLFYSGIFWILRSIRWTLNYSHDDLKCQELFIAVETLAFSVISSCCFPHQGIFLIFVGYSNFNFKIFSNIIVVSRWFLVLILLAVDQETTSFFSERKTRKVIVLKFNELWKLNCLSSIIATASLQIFSTTHTKNRARLLFFSSCLFCRFFGITLRKKKSNDV